MSTAEDINEYYDKKKEACVLQQEQNDKLAKGSSGTKVNQTWFSQATDSVWNEISTGPLGQLGKNFVEEQITQNGTRLLNNVESQVTRKIGPLVKSVVDIKDIIFNSIALATTAQSQMGLYFMQQVAGKCVKALDKKMEALTTLQESLRQLYNAVVILTAGKPYFQTYLKRLRQALILIDQSRKDLQTAHDTLGKRNRWTPKKIDSAKQALEDALKLMEPNRLQTPANKITDSGLLANVGIPKISQQIGMITIIPKLCRDVTLSMNGYLIANIKVNALLAAFCNGYSELESLSSSIMSNYTLDSLESIISSMDELIADMGLSLNGGPVASVAPGFSPNEHSTRITVEALGWIMRVRSFRESLKVLPGTSLNIVDKANDQVKNYVTIVNKIKAMDGMTSGAAVLLETDGKEEIGQLERQVIQFVLFSMAATVSGSASKTIVQTGRTILARLDMSIKRTRDLRTMLDRFSKQDLGFSKQLKALGSGINGILRSFGLDRAADFLEGGKFKEFFNMNNKLMTYAGAALAGLSLLKNCLTSDSDRDKLDKVELSIKKDDFSKTLIARRSVNSSFTLRSEEIARKCKENDTDQGKVNDTTKSLSGPCGLSFPTGSNLMSTLGPVVGLTLFNTGTAQKALAKYGRGIL